MKPAPDPPSAAKDALRIQAAAVAAQQAALGDEEARLQQRRGALEQQEGQLAAHLEDKRQRLVQLREEAQAARLALQKEQAVYHETVEKTRRDLTQTQKEVQQAKDQAQTERQRLVGLQRRLKQRWHRHWMAQRRALRQREIALASQRHQLDKEGECLEQQRAELAQQRLRVNGAAELGKRQLQDEWERLRQEQQAWKAHRQREQAELQQRARALEQGEAAVAQAQRDLAYDQHQWQGLRLLLEREAEGLDARILNQRRKINEQQDEIGRLEAAQRGLRPPGSTILPHLAPVTIEADPDALELPPTRPGALIPFSASATPANEHPAPHAGTALAVEEERLADREAQLKVAENGLQSRLRALQHLAGELADQRLQLVEQWQRLAHTQERWQQERDTAAAELEALAAGLPEREQALIVNEQRQEAARCDFQRRHLELVQQRHHLEGWQLRLRAREAAWEAQRERVLSDLRSRAEAAARLQATAVELRRRWTKRRKQELEQLRGERAAGEKLRQEWLTLRDECWRRATALEEQRRVLAEKELALERYRQQFLTGTKDAAAAERAVERLRRRWARQNAAVVRASTEVRRQLHAEAAQLQAHGAVLQQQTDALTQREASLAEQQTALEHRETLAHGQQIRVQEEVQRLRAQRDRSEQKCSELQDEVERIALLLLQEPSEILPRMGQAA